MWNISERKYGKKREKNSLLLTLVASVQSTKLAGSFGQELAGRLWAGKETVSSIRSLPG